MTIFRWFARLFARDHSDYLTLTDERRWMDVQRERSR